MLSGRVPFQVSGPDKASKIMDRIKVGMFSLKGAVWNVVSESAKDIIKGNILSKLGCTLNGNDDELQKNVLMSVVLVRC